MTKCDWCKHSQLKGGKLKCPFDWCIMSEDELKAIIRQVGREATK